tara:strand:- start:182 stop:313 length:132 start_codon:yes stop_codon:yes gene_type:complete
MDSELAMGISVMPINPNRKQFTIYKIGLIKDIFCQKGGSKVME